MKHILKKSTISNLNYLLKVISLFLTIVILLNQKKMTEIKETKKNLGIKLKNKSD